MATTTDLMLAGNLDQARAVTDAALASEGFAVRYSEPWTARAERGSAAATVLVGAFSGKKHQHVEIGIAYRTADSGRTVLTLSKLTSGAAAGLIGMSRAKKAYEEAVAGIRAALSASGQLVG